MKKLLLIIIIFNSLFCYSQEIDWNQGDIEQKKYFEKIPFEGTFGTFYVKVSINGKLYNFLFDTGAPFAVTEKLFKELNLESKKNTNIIDGTGSITAMKFVQVPKIELQGLVFLNSTGLVLPKSAEEMLGCYNIEGIIGSNMLRNSVVQFDYENREIIITDNAKNLDLKNATNQKIKLDGQSNPILTVKLINNNNIATDDNTLLDSGFNGFYEIQTNTYKNLESKTNISKKIAESEGFSSWGVSGSQILIKKTVSIVPNISIANHKFDNVVINTTNFANSLIGGKIFEFGKITLDYSKKKLYFESYPNTNTEAVSKTNWSIQFTVKNQKIIVGTIWDKSLESQVNIGDEIVSADGLNYTSLTFCELIKIKRDYDKPSVIVELKDIKTGELKKIEIKRI